MTSPFSNPTPGGPSSAEMREWMECFMYYDRDHDGLVDWELMPTMMRSLGRTPSDGDALSLARSVDMGGNNFNMQGFFKVMAESYIPPNKISIIIEDSFRLFDLKNQGKIAKDDLQHALTILSKRLGFPKEMVDGVLAQAKPDFSGKIPYRNLMKSFLNSETPQPQA